MRHRTVRRTSLAGLAVAAVLTVGLASGPATAASAARKVTTTTATRCAIFTYQTPTDWYFPATSPKALVWLQHGFTESRDQYTGFADQLAAQGFLVVATTLPSADLFGCSVNNLGNNTAYLNNVARLFGTKDSATGALNKSFVAARAAAGRPEVRMPRSMAFVGHSAVIPRPSPR